jgi:hypothetical protein
LLVKQNHHQYTVPGLFVLLALIIWLVLMHEFRLDDSFITYRYARNAANGLGLVYNADDAVLSTTAPLYALLLAAGSWVITDYHVLGGLIGAVCIGLGGGLIYKLLPASTGIVGRVFGGLLYVVSTPLWLALGMETPLWIMLVLGAVLLMSMRRWVVCGAVIGIATLIRPDAALPGVLIGVAALVFSVNARDTRRHWWLPVTFYGVTAAFPLILFGTWGMLTYGSPLPVTLGAKSAQAVMGITGMGVDVSMLDGLVLIIRSLLAQSPFYLLVGMLAVLGFATLSTLRVSIVVSWGVLHMVAYMLLQTAPYRWYYVPLLPGVILLAALGLNRLTTWLKSRQGLFLSRSAGVGLVGLTLIGPLMSFGAVARYLDSGGPSDVMLPIVDWEVYREAGDWLKQNTSPDATIGVAEVGQVGFYADRWMTDYLGLLQPDVAMMLRRGDFYSWLIKYAPDYLVFQRFRGAPLVLYNYLIGDDPWFVGSYREIIEFDDPRYSSGPVTIFERVTTMKMLQVQPVVADFDGLRLVGLMTDGYDLSRPAEAVRVRLDWEVVGSLPENLHIAVKALDLPVFPGYDGDYQTAQWEGMFSTWHGFVWLDEVTPGDYPLHVAVGPTGGPYKGQNVGWFTVR